MGALIRLIPAILLFSATPAGADGNDRWRFMIEEASTRFGVPTSWIERVMQAESRGRTILNNRPIRSRAGAMGLMQLMPSTWAEMRVRLALGNNPDDPHDNILAGAFYLRLMYERFGYPGLFGAYNAGPRVYAAYLAGRRRLPDETIAYLGSLGGTAVPASPAERSSPPPLLFVVRRAVATEQSVTSDDDRQASLFAVRKVMP